MGKSVGLEGGDRHEDDWRRFRLTGEGLELLRQLCGMVVLVSNLVSTTSINDQADLKKKTICTFTSPHCQDLVNKL